MENVPKLLDRLLELISQIDEDSLYNRFSKEILLYDINNFKCIYQSEEMSNMVDLYMERAIDPLIIRKLNIPESVKVDILSIWSVLGYYLRDCIVDFVPKDDAQFILLKYKHKGINFLEQHLNYTFS